MYNYFIIKKLLLLLIIIFSSINFLYCNVDYNLFKIKSKDIKYYNNKNYLKSINFFSSFLEKKENDIHINYKIATSLYYTENYFLASNFFLKYFNSTNLVNALYKSFYCYYLSLNKDDIDESNLYYLYNHLYQYKNIYINNIPILKSINYLIKKLKYYIIINDFKKIKYLYEQGFYRNALFGFSKFIKNNPNNILVEEALYYFINSHLNIISLFNNNSFDLFDNSSSLLFENNSYLLRNHNKNIIELCIEFITLFPKSKYKNYISNIYNKKIYNIYNRIENSFIFLKTMNL